ncbi:hypothetical protein GCM10025864_11890 [Luteimicrobium album]|uniref:RNA polymerase sigma factor 70 region 4 type 2 domain-containing protein n=1 Tax=Luteimicrobium album TaxID=1054550 RepID=A0ABQ6I0X7_9MICO|nr:hypothetical protein GCM10025864_11890 [Luteimicrobium album]
MARRRSPRDPKAWLVTVASRRYVDAWRSDSARERRELEDAARTPSGGLLAPGADAFAAPEHDDTLTLLVLCCHPVLPPASQVALTLRAVAGLTTAQVARAYLVPEPTMAQRISRAKARLREAGARFVPPPVEELPARVAAVSQVLYLVFTEGHTTTSGAGLVDVSLADEAIRLTRELHRLVPSDDEVTGLLALMLLTHARRAARTTADGALVPLAEQDRRRWDRDLIAEGWRSSRRRCPSDPWARTSSRPRSPRCTTRPRPRTRRTGPRSTSCTGCSSGSRPGRW